MSAGPDRARAVTATQLSFPELAEPRPVRLRARASRRSAPNGAASAPSLIDGFGGRLKALGASHETQSAYLFQLGQVLEAARRHRTGPVDSAVAVFRDEELLGLALTDDRSANGGVLSRWTLAQRRTAIRAFARLMAPDLRPLLGVDPLEIVSQSLRRVAVRVGGGYRLGGGAPRQRGGSVPTTVQLDAIIDETAKVSGYQGARNAAFFALLYETGSRVNSLRELMGDDVCTLPGGRMRLLLHAKGKDAKREVELSNRGADLLLTCVAAFNRDALIAGRCERITFGEAVPVWRSSWQTQWAYRGIAHELSHACDVLGCPRFTLHSLRRAFASVAASVLPRHVVARAGGWQGLRRLDDHYVHPTEDAVLGKLSRMKAEERRPIQHESPTALV